MKFVQVGTHIVSVEHVVRAEIKPGTPKRVDVFFTGGTSIGLQGADAQALLDELEAEVIPRPHPNSGLDEVLKDIRPEDVIKPG